MSVLNSIVQVVDLLNQHIRDTAQCLAPLGRKAKGSSQGQEDYLH